MKSVNTYFESFLKSGDTVRIISPGGTIFRSQKRGISPLLNYIEQSPLMDEVVVLDKITGNAAALLMKKACCREVLSPLGSELAAESLQCFGIVRHFMKTVPHIINREGNGMCPFEKMSIGKSPDEFYELVKNNPLFTDTPDSGSP
ncbi:MAG: DUF1893 domain-containing protein [Thermodesulfobacteriota bacterium]|nr:DUF1893 domain-containing protein [Thermodesulfobacteriota bacterium]